MPTGLSSHTILFNQAIKTLEFGRVSMQVVLSSSLQTAEVIFLQSVRTMAAKLSLAKNSLTGSSHFLSKLQQTLPLKAS